MTHAFVRISDFLSRKSSKGVPVEASDLLVLPVKVQTHLVLI